MTKDEALDLALEALEKISRTHYHIETPPIESLEEKMRRIADKAITAIKQALALDKKAENARELGLDYEPVQEPVKWSDHEPDGRRYPAVPDAFGTREGEHPQYIQGWNDCRAEMLSMRKRVKP
jgi:hypothetical protein